MNEEPSLIWQIKKDFAEFKKGCLGIILFGSYARRDQTRRSDVDICLVKPLREILEKINSKLGGKYDIKVFESLPLHLKIETIENGKLIYGNEIELSEYFYPFRRLWSDMRRRMAENEFRGVEEGMKLRRMWMDEKEKIVRETGKV